MAFIVIPNQLTILAHWRDNKLKNNKKLFPQMICDMAEEEQ